MPSAYERATPGANNTDFGQAPGFNQALGRELSTPGLNARPNTERLDQLRSLLSAAGSAITGATSSEARRQAIVKARRDERIAASRRLAAEVQAKKDAELTESQRQYKLAMQDRMRAVEQEQFNILRDPRSESAEWVMNQAVLQQENAGSDDEASAWNDFIIRYQMKAREDSRMSAERMAREANQQLASDTALAAKTAQQTIDLLAQDVDSNPELSQYLMGDGRNITERVFEYAYEAAMEAAPDLFQLSKSDPMYAQKKRAADELLLEIESRALHTIAKPLIKRAAKEQEGASEVAGWDMIEAQQLAYAEERISAEEYHDTIGDIIRVKFAHLDTEKRDELRTKMYTAQFNRLVSLLDDDDPGRTLDRMEGLLSLADLSDSEKNAIRQNIISDKFPKAIANRLTQQFASMENSLRSVTVGPEGRPMGWSDPRQAQLDMLKNPEGIPGGPSRYMDLGAQMLDKLGVKPGVELTPLQANLQMAVLAQVDAAEAQARQLQRSLDQKVDIGVKLRQGAALTAEEATKAWHGGWSMTAMGGEMTPADPVYQILAAEYKQRFGKDIPWDGQSPLVLNEATEEIGVMLAREDAKSWRSNLSTPLPGALTSRVAEFVRSGDPSQVKWALNFFHHMGPAGQERLSKALGTGKDAVLINAVLQEGERLLFSPRETAAEQDQDITAVVNKMRSITESMANNANYRAMVDAGVRWEKDQKYNTDASKALYKALRRSPEDGGFGARRGSGTYEEAIMDVLAMDKENLATLYQRAYIIQDLNPGTSLDTAMSTVVAEMRSQGYTVAESDRGQVIVRDTYNHLSYDPQKDQQVLNDFELWRNFPLDQKYHYGMKNIMSQRLTDRALAEYGAALGATEADIQFARERGSRKDWLLWSVLDREAKASGVTGVPLPDEWAWRTGPMSGVEFEREMGLPDGGVPMILEMPGIQPMAPLYHNGRALHTFSATRLSMAEGSLVNRQRLVNNHMTTPSRSKIRAKPDSAKRLEALDMLGAASFMN